MQYSLRTLMIAMTCFAVAVFAVDRGIFALFVRPPPELMLGLCYLLALAAVVITVLRGR